MTFKLGIAMIKEELDALDELSDEDKTPEAFKKNLSGPM